MDKHNDTKKRNEFKIFFYMNYNLILALLLFSQNIVFAQKSNPDSHLNSKSKSVIVMNVSQLLLDNYVYPDTAIRFSKYIQQRLKSGAYENITDPVVFSDVLSNDLYAVYHDKHLSVQYNPALASQLSDPVSPAETVIETVPKRNRDANFGLSKIEILKGNIGLLELNHFWADKIYGAETVKAAFKFLANTNALIIDVRSNGGGSPETVSMICSYFFPDSIHINDSYSRPDNVTTEYWTNPDTAFGVFTKMPLYILCSNKTFSAAEEFAYDLQSLKRAVIVGEPTGGGAHNTFEQSAGNGFVVYIPYGRAINAVTGTNWETVGVKPDIVVSAEKALETAELEVFETLIAGTKDSAELFSLHWQLALMRAINNPIVLGPDILKKYAGIYGERAFTFENGKLFYQRRGKPKFELEAMTLSMMKGKGNDYFKIEFIENAQGAVNQVKAYYQDNRIETSFRTE